MTRRAFFVQPLALRAMTTATWIDASLVSSREKPIEALEPTKSTVKDKVTILQPRLTISEIVACKKDGAATKRGI
ncbi:MAG: hypothetical protein EOO77_41940 [Oxalobacteraceae bacterium]|nr:MAG: hypothetical protein EOO77_41940 [Oxalobacteraceae bacterium]